VVLVRSRSSKQLPAPFKTLSRAQPAQFDARQAARRFVRGDELASAAPLMRIKGDFPLGGYYFE